MMVRSDGGEYYRIVANGCLSKVSATGKKSDEGN